MTFNPLQPFAVAWQHRRLIWRLSKREIEAKYRGTLLGMFWGFALPLATLAVYTFVFTNIFHARWTTPTGQTSEVALLMFSGILFYGVFAETVNRSPSLVTDHVSYVKKVVFPLEILPWVAVTTAICTSAMGFSMLFAASLAVSGLPPAQFPLFFALFVPLVLFALGLSWFFASLGVFVQDIKQIIGVGTTLLMFLTPILYPVAAVPQDVRWILSLNPLTPIIELSKVALFFGGDFDWRTLVALTLFSWAVAWLGLAWFMKTKKAFADVI